MVIASTLSLRQIGAIPRWLAVVGYDAASHARSRSPN
jgi:hypothetical protein